MIYSRPISKPTQNHSAIMRNPKSLQKLITTYDPAVSTVLDLWLLSYSKNPDRPCLGQIVEEKIVQKSYKQVHSQANAIASAINKNEYASLVQQKGQKMKMIGICSKNRQQWMITDIACLLSGCTSVSLYDTLKQDGIDYAINLTQLSTVFCSKSSLNFISNAKCPSLKNVIYFDEPDQQSLKRFSQNKIQLINFQSLLQKHKGQIVQHPKLKSDNTYTLCFTSGTTGLPKAAKIQHGGLVANITVCAQQKCLAITNQDIHFSYLPLPHVFQRMMMLFVLSQGAQAVFYRGDPLKIIQDINIIKPTVLIGVPRILNRLYDKIKSTILPTPDAPASQLLDKKQKLFKQNLTYQVPQLDQKLFNKTKASIGGRVRYLITGSAPISAEVLDFLKIVFCCPIIQGYGQTETYGASFITTDMDPQAGHVGGVTAGSQYRLQDVPQLEYLTTDKNTQGQLTPRGQVCLRGAVIKSYFKDPQRTKQIIDQQGWLHTGDIGVIRPNGSLKLIDRKKNIFKLQQGQYVAPQRVQNIYIQEGIVTQIYVHGDSIQNYCVAIAVIQPSKIGSLIKQMNLPQDINVNQNIEIKKCVLKKLNVYGRKIGLNGFELARNIHFSKQGFILKGIYTSTMKMQRHVAKKIFLSQIQRMYKQGPLPQ